MRILIADDQVRVRQALRVLLTQQPGVRVIGEAADGEELLAACRREWLPVGAKLW